ncbi:hypothetical protein [Microcoleus sp.]|uniref:hypothetical protein n=1 Tax=Microcoleus sp. TaxID=44472 RepID=UPI003524633D
MQSRITGHRKKEEGRRKKEEGRRKKEEGRRTPPAPPRGEIQPSLAPPRGEIQPPLAPPRGEGGNSGRRKKALRFSKSVKRHYTDFDTNTPIQFRAGSPAHPTKKITLCGTGPTASTGKKFGLR